MDLHGSLFLETLGLKLLDDGLEDMVEYISGVNDTLLADVNFAYDGGDSPKFSIDRLAATDAQELYRSEDGYGRIFLNDPGASFKAISSSVVFGAFRDGDSLSMKPYLMAEMIDYFLGVATVTDIKEAFGQATNHQVVAYPNPASSYTNLKFTLEHNSDVSISFYNEKADLHRKLSIENAAAGNHSITWDLNDTNGKQVENGFYFFRISANDKILSSGKLLIQR